MKFLSKDKEKAGLIFSAQIVTKVTEGFGMIVF
jgi:hypothetical protein